MQSESSVTFSVSVLEDLRALIAHLEAQAGDYNPRDGISLDGMLDFVRTLEGPKTGVVSVPPGAFGRPIKITPVHNALDRLQFIEDNGADYATGIVELALSHNIEQPVDIDFNSRHFREHNMNRLPEPLDLMLDFQTAVNAHLIVAIPNLLRPDTLVFVILLGRGDHWSERHEQALHRTLEQSTKTSWTPERKPLK